ncbi:MAG: deoxyribodipyrimidine photolyase [Alphaproteobacteria bacterium]|jgi:deoxyribodipyrimidine photo-lyase|nr:deoxyribodipyrimidine photolyase [Alphaproteobacteria bacterium]
MTRTSPPLHVVWFKRDLRVHDHVPLAEAAARGPVLALYIAEPGFWALPDSSGRQWRFVAEGLTELDAELRARGGGLVVRTGDAVEVLRDVLDRMPVAALWSHQETGNAWTYARDRRVAELLRERGVAWHERRQHGVIRGLTRRDGWAARWEKLMRAPVAEAPAALNPPVLDGAAIPSAAALGLADDPPQRQPGGRDAGLDLLTGFVGPRGRDYRRAMATPVEAFDACSRLSPHLAWGTLSLREVYQRSRAELAAHDGPDGDRTQAQSLVSFRSRLHWHCHFIQKLESQPSIEFTHFHRAYDRLDRDADPAKLEAFAEGRTGYPFVDACLRALAAHGWINFRVRAMLVSFASYHLWLDWRATGPLLARWFTDFEPGIHWSQMQMQSGTTGINTVRIYSPIKQSRDLDPHGVFIRRWVPELAGLAAKALHEPWKSGAAAGLDYPPPVVDHASAVRSARDRIFAVRIGAGYGEEADTVQARHGSRRSGLPRTGRGPRGRADAKQRRESRQLGLEL